MDNPDQRAAVKTLVEILRKITRVAKIMPFVYLGILALCMAADCILPEWACRVADSALNLPIYGIVGMCGIGRLLKLCAWHRTACLLPSATKIASYIDSYVITFTQGEMLALHIIFALSYITFLALSYRHFFAR